MFILNFIIYLKWLVGIYFLSLREVLSVAVTEIRFLSDSNRPEYILQGEGATLTCHYVLDKLEEVTEVEWEKDGTLIYLWTLDGQRRTFNFLKDNVDISLNSPSTLSILKVTREMAGKYTCRVRTNGKRAHNDVHIRVIIDACPDSSWKTYSDMITCTETITMHCAGIFPKPSPACGVYSEKTGKYLNSVPLDTLNTLENGTFEVGFNRRFSVEEWINHTDISFRCYMIISGTQWRSGIRHRMFGDPGCQKLPSDIFHGYYNMSDERSCWGFPAEGAKAEYRCESGYQMWGSSLHICKSGEWVPEGIVVEGDYEIPICNNSIMSSPSFILYWTLSILILLKRWT